MTKVYSKDQKIRENLLAPTFCTYLNSLASQNITTANSNTNSTDNLIAQVTRAKEVKAGMTTDLIEYIDSKNSELYHAIHNYTGMDGKGEGINFAYNNGLPGQMLKADKVECARIWPTDNFVTCRLCTSLNQETVLNEPASDPNDKYAYNAELHLAYYRDREDKWHHMDPIDKSKLWFLYETFILDPVSKNFWFCVNPSTFIYLWKSSIISSNISNTDQTPRDQPNVDYVVDDNTIWYKTAQPLQDAATIMKETLKPTTYYNSASNYIVGDQMYNGVDHVYMYFEYISVFKFDAKWSGIAKLTITVSYNHTDIIGPSYMEKDKYFIIQDHEKVSRPRYSDGYLKLSLNDKPSEDKDGNIIENYHIQEKGYGNWEYTTTVTAELEEGSNYISCWTQASAYNHLYVTHIQIKAEYP